MINKLFFVRRRLARQLAAMRGPRCKKGAKKPDKTKPDDNDANQ